MRNNTSYPNRVLVSFKTPEKIRLFLEEYECLYNNYNPITVDERFKELFLESLYLHFLVELDINLEMNLIVMHYNILKDHMVTLLKRSQEQINFSSLDNIIKLLESGIWDFILDIENYGKRYLFDREIFKLKLFNINKSKIEFLTLDPTDDNQE